MHIDGPRNFLLLNPVYDDYQCQPITFHWQHQCLCMLHDQGYAWKYNEIRWYQQSSVTAWAIAILYFHLIVTKLNNPLMQCISELQLKKWTNHVDKIVAKANTTISFLKWSFCNLTVKKMLLNCDLDHAWVHTHRLTFISSKWSNIELLVSSCYSHLASVTEMLNKLNLTITIKHEAYYHVQLQAHQPS